MWPGPMEIAWYSRACFGTGTPDPLDLHVEAHPLIVLEDTARQIPAGLWVLVTDRGNNW